MHQKEEKIQPSVQEPQKYFDLIQIVGSKGKYQRNIFLIFLINWFVSGMLLMGTSFLYMNPSFNCEGTIQEIKICEQKICAMDPSEWHKYLNKPYVESLATEFGPYLCDQKNVLNEYRMALYIGAFLGYSVFLFITDNYGRKTSALFAWGVTTFGVILLATAQTMWIASVGLVLAGAGCQSSLRISLTTVGEIVDYYKRQSYSILLQVMFGFAGVAVGMVYWLIPKWRIVTIVFCLVPCIIYLLLLIFYLEQTPKFLIVKKGTQKAMKSLNRIGNINQGNPSLMKQIYITKVHEKQNGKNDEYQFLITPYHLFKFKSLRKNTILCSIIFMLSTYLYYGPVVIVDKLSSNPFVSQIVIGMAQFLSCPLSYWFIEKIPRVKAGKVSYVFALTFNVILIFINPGQQCKGCFLGYIQIFLVFASRFVVTFFSSILFLYATELFPQRARGLGFGFISAMGAIASSSGQYIFSELQDKHINPMIFFSLFSLIALITFFFMKETHNIPLQDEIQEIQVLKRSKQDGKSEDFSDRDDIITSKTDEQGQQKQQGLLEDHK